MWLFAGGMTFGIFCTLAVVKFVLKLEIDELNTAADNLANLRQQDIFWRAGRAPET